MAAKKKASRKKAAKKKAGARRKTEKPWKASLREQRFIDELDACPIGSVAAIRAGYAESGARTQASRLLANANIKKEIEKRAAARRERLKISADTVLEELSLLATCTLSEFIDEEGNLRDDFQNIPEHALGLLRKVKITDTFTGSGEDLTPVRTMEIQLHDRIQALVNLGKHKDIQAFIENLQMDVRGFGEKMDRVAAARKRAGLV